MILGTGHYLWPPFFIQYLRDDPSPHLISPLRSIIKMHVTILSDTLLRVKTSLVNKRTNHKMIIYFQYTLHNIGTYLLCYKISV